MANMRMRTSSILGIVIGMTSLCGCVQSHLPAISTSRYEMPEPCQVEACFRGLGVYEWRGRILTNAQFTVERPPRYAGKVVTYDTFWIGFDLNQLTTGQVYRLTLPLWGVEEQEPVCGWGLELKQ